RVSLAIGSLIFPLNIRRQRNMAQPVQVFGRRLAVAAQQSHRPQPQLAARNNLGLEFAATEHHALANRQLPARPDHPLLGVLPNQLGEEHVHSAGEMLAVGSPRGWLRVRSGSLSKQTRRNHSSVIENQELGATEKLRKPRKSVVGPGTRTPVKQQQAR